MLSSYWSPKSFDEAWTGNFFLVKAIMAVTSLGFSIARIPILHTLSLGGRLKHCLLNWVNIGASDWVCKVVSEGYRIPLRNNPKQYKIPSNPTISDSALEVLSTEAKDFPV